MTKSLILTANSPDDEPKLHYALHGLDYLLVLSDLDTELRNRAKYDEVDDVKIGWVRQYIRELMEERGVSLEDLE